MQTQTLVFTVLVCLATAVTARHTDPDANQPDHEAHLRPRDQTKHRRRRWQSNYPDLNTEILRVLDEISTYIRRAPPPPPPQPIYIPYPVFAAPNCRRKQPSNPAINNRYPFMEDTRQNWGFEAEDDDEDGDYSRPLEFRPAAPAQTESPVRNTGGGPAAGAGAGRSPSSISGSSLPSVCDGAVLSCCLPTFSKQAQKQCFNTAGCSRQYNSASCSQDTINSVILLYSQAYQNNK